MGGVRVGSRLEQLRKLRDQVSLEIELEERREALETARPARAVQQSVRSKRNLTNGVGKGSSSVLIRERLEQLGVTSKTVKTWAVTQGLLPEVVRGTCKVEIIDAYAQAHNKPMVAGEV